METKAGPRKRPKEMTTGSLWQQLNEAGRSNSDQNVHALKAEMHSRLTAPLTPLVFALFGLPFSIQSHRSGRSGGFVIGLIIYLCYYLFLSLAQTLTADAGFTPWLTFWVPHLLLCLSGIYCLYRTANEQPIHVVIWLERAILSLRNLAKKNHDHS